MWVKFDEEGFVECFCENGKKKCSEKPDFECSEYVVKFMKIDRNKLGDLKDAVDDAGKTLIASEAEVKRQLKKFETEIQKSVREFKKFKI
jgi:hypothetical protein